MKVPLHITPEEARAAFDDLARHMDALAEFRRALPRLLWTIRVGMGMPGVKFAALMGSSQPTLSRIEMGQDVPRDHWLRQLLAMRKYLDEQKDGAA